MRFRNLLVSISLMVLVSACGGNGDFGALFGTSIGNAGSAEQGNYLATQADLSAARSLTLPIAGQNNEKRALLKITYDGKLEKVLSGAEDIQFWKETPTHIIAQVNIFEGKRECHLIAIPKVQYKTKVLCLSRDRLQDPNLDKPATRPRFDVRGSKVYFVSDSFNEPKPDDSYYADDYDPRWSQLGITHISELRSWDGVSETTHTEAHFEDTREHVPPILHVFTSPKTEATCFGLGRYEYGSYYNVKGGEGLFYCRENDHAKWRVMGELTVADDAMKYGNWVLSGGDKFDLDTLKNSSRSGYELPALVYAPLEKGGFIGTSDRKIVCVDGNGNTGSIYPMDFKTQLVKVGKEAWFFGTHSLKKLSLADCSAEARDYFNDTGLMSLSGISWLVGDNLRIDGSANGNPATVILDANGVVRGTHIDAMTIDHPIDLHWNL